MRKFTFLLVALLLSVASVTAQDKNEVFEIIDEMPELIGGIAGLQKHMRYPEDAQKSNIEGRVIVQFVVDEKGDVRDPVILRSLSDSCDREAIRVITEHAKFIPGYKKEGHPVPVRISLPIQFKLR